jgi:hypothetical protein
MSKLDKFVGRPSRVWSHGKWIEVGYLDDPLRTKKQANRPKRKPFRIGWVKLPTYWIEQLKQAASIATYKLALHILREAYKQQHLGGEIVLSAAATGLTRSIRRLGTKELVKLNLIRIAKENHKAPRVTELLFDGVKAKRRGKNGQ